MGESARKPGAPTLPLTPEELLTAGPNEGFSWFDRNITSIFGAAILATAPALVNWKLSRPFFAGIYKHAIFGGVGYVLGQWYAQTRLAQRMEKDAIFLHYISLHPEDFPPFERERYKDKFLPWVPKR